MGVYGFKDRGAFCLRMARRLEQLVSKLWERKLGVQRSGPDDASACVHQRPAHCRVGPEISLAAGSPSRRSRRIERTGILIRVLVSVFCLTSQNRGETNFEWRARRCVPALLGLNDSLLMNTHAR